MLDKEGRFLRSHVALVEAKALPFQINKTVEALAKIGTDCFSLRLSVNVGLKLLSSFVAEKGSQRLSEISSCERILIIGPLEPEDVCSAQIEDYGIRFFSS